MQLHLRNFSRMKCHVRNHGAIHKNLWWRLYPSNAEKATTIWNWILLGVDKKKEKRISTNKWDLFEDRFTIEEKSSVGQRIRFALYVAHWLNATMGPARIPFGRLLFACAGWWGDFPPVDVKKKRILLLRAGFVWSSQHLRLLTVRNDDIVNTPP